MHKNGSSAGGKQDAANPVGLCDYGARMVTERLHKMLSQADDVQRNEETEPVHKMRVSSRRTRAALEIFDPCFASDDYSQLEREVKRVTDVLSEARDLDVMQERLADHLRELPQEQQTGIQGFIDQLRERRMKAQKFVDKTVRQLENHGLEARFKAIAAQDDHDRAIRRATRRENGHG